MTSYQWNQQAEQYRTIGNNGAAEVAERMARITAKHEAAEHDRAWSNVGAN